MFKKVILNTGSQIMGKIVSATSTLIITFLIGRSLGAAGYGDFTKIFVFVGYFYILGDFGLNTIFIKLMGEKISYIFQVMIGVRIALALFLTLLSIFIAFLLPYDPQTLVGFSPLVKIGITIASLTIITQTLLTTANAFFQKKLRYDLSSLSIIIGTFVVLITTLIASIIQPNLIIFILAYIFGGITFVASAFYLIQKKFKQKIKPIFNITESLKILALSWPVGLALIFNLIYFRLDVFILSANRTSLEVGIYGLAFQFFEASLTIPIFFANSIYPVLTNLFNKDQNEYAKQVKFWLKSLIAISFFFAISLIMISFLIPSVFGASFNGTPVSLRILALGTPFFYVSAILWVLVIIHDKQKYLSLIYACGAIFNFSTNVIFVPKYGYIASSVITVASEALIMILLVIALKWHKIASKV